MADSVQFNIRVDKQLLEKIDQKAKELGLTRSSFIRLSCVEYMQNHSENAHKN